MTDSKETRYFADNPEELVDDFSDKLYKFVEEHAPPEHPLVLAECLGVAFIAAMGGCHVCASGAVKQLAETLGLPLDEHVSVAIAEVLVRYAPDKTLN